MFPIRIVTVTRNDFIRNGLPAILQQRMPHVDFCGFYNTLADMNRWLATSPPPPTILILDDDDPFYPLIQNLDVLLSHYPKLKLIILSDILGEHYINILLKAGLHGFIFKHDHLEDALPTCIRVVLNDEIYISPRASSLPYQRNVEELNDTDLCLLHLMARGYTVYEIATRLNIATRSVYRIRRKLREYLSVRTNEQIVEVARQRGLLRADIYYQHRMTNDRF